MGAARLEDSISLLNGFQDGFKPLMCNSDVSYSSDAGDQEKTWSSFLIDGAEAEELCCFMQT